TDNPGANILTGYAGNDTYYSSGDADTIVENPDEGTDILMASGNHTLDANVENLTLVGWANINGTGNTGNNILLGNLGENILNGGNGNDTLDGGIGLDTLIGGLGDDTYVVNNLEGGTTSILLKGEPNEWPGLPYASSFPGI